MSTTILPDRTPVRTPPPIYTAEQRLAAACDVLDRLRPHLSYQAHQRLAERLASALIDQLIGSEVRRG